jgi:hypothetical protein
MADKPGLVKAAAGANLYDLMQLKDEPWRRRTAGTQ